VSPATCPNGHTSTATDYCDTCGAPITEAGAETAQPSPDPASAAPAVQTCPNCGDENAADALFCESCGYDFTTGAMPRPAAPAEAAAASMLDLGSPPPAATPGPVDWVVERWVDPDWYAVQQSDDPCPSPGLPVVVPLKAGSVLVGRPSKSRNIHPDIDCDGDTGVSRRQAQLTTDGQRWWVEDLQSSNGTYVGPASGPLPTDPVPPGQRRELGDDDRIYVGAWTRLVIRRATPDEQAGQA
jgi:FHA domain/Double zinc ribbon